jgi:hypothetical protein
MGRPRTSVHGAAAAPATVFRSSAARAAAAPVARYFSGVPLGHHCSIKQAAAAVESRSGSTQRQRRRRRRCALTEGGVFPGLSRWSAAGRRCVAVPQQQQRQWQQQQQQQQWRGRTRQRNLWHCVGAPHLDTTPRRQGHCGGRMAQTTPVLAARRVLVLVLGCRMGQPALTSLVHSVYSAVLQSCRHAVIVLYFIFFRVTCHVVN